MLHLTAFGATEAEISPAGFTAFTIFGGASLKRPTLAQRIMQRRREAALKPTRWEAWLGRDRSLVITLFGGTEIIVPTVMEEFAALRNLVGSGVISREECRRLIEELAGSEDARADVSRVTLFGVCSFESPSPEMERKALDAAEGARVITAEKREELAGLIGCPSGAAPDMLAHIALA